MDGRKHQYGALSINAKADMRIALRKLPDQNRVKYIINQIYLSEPQAVELEACLALVQEKPAGEDLARFEEFQEMTIKPSLLVGLARLLHRFPKRNIAYFNLTADLVMIGGKAFESLGVPKIIPSKTKEADKKEGDLHLPIKRAPPPPHVCFGKLLEGLSTPPIYGDVVLVSPDIARCLLPDILAGRPAHWILGVSQTGLRIMSPVHDPSGEEGEVSEFIEYL